MTMELKGRQCILRPWHGSDADALARHADNFNVARQLRDRFPHPYTRADATAFIKLVSAMPEPTNLAIEVDQQAVGGIGFMPGADVERYSAEVGYWVAEQYWGRGIASEAVVLVTEHAFDVHDLLRLFALPFADNAASRRVLEKAGYVCEGILRASSVKFGQPRDQAMYAHINPRWRGVR